MIQWRCKTSYQHDFISQLSYKMNPYAAAGELTLAGSCSIIKLQEAIPHSLPRYTPIPHYVSMQLNRNSPFVKVGCFCYIEDVNVNPV